jgi:hypothetical protein
LRFLPEQEPFVAIYYFHLADGQDSLLDPEGRDVDVAQLPALSLHEARAIMSHDVMRGHIDLAQFIQVRDAAGKLVHQLSFKDAVTIAGA